MLINNFSNAIIEILKDCINIVAPDSLPRTSDQFTFPTSDISACLDYQA